MIDNERREKESWIIIRRVKSAYKIRLRGRCEVGEKGFKRLAKVVRDLG